MGKHLETAQVFNVERVNSQLPEFVSLTRSEHHEANARRRRLYKRLDLQARRRRDALPARGRALAPIAHERQERVHAQVDVAGAVGRLPNRQGQVRDHDPSSRLAGWRGRQGGGACPQRARRILIRPG